MDRFEEMLERSFAGHRAGSEPDVDDFRRYLSGELEQGDQERMERFIRENRWAQDFVLEARGLLAEPSQRRDAPEEWVRSAASLRPDLSASHVCPQCARRAAGLRKPDPRAAILRILYLVLAVAFFAASFVVARYFMQLLALGVLCAVKWIVEHRAAKTQIMIYRALSGEEANETHRLQGHGSRL